MGEQLVGGIPPSTAGKEQVSPWTGTIVDVIILSYSNIPGLKSGGLIFLVGAITDCYCPIPLEAIDLQKFVEDGLF